MDGEWEGRRVELLLCVEKRRREPYLHSSIRDGPIDRLGSILRDLYGALLEADGGGEETNIAGESLAEHCDGRWKIEVLVSVRSVCEKCLWEVCCWVELTVVVVAVRELGSAV